MITKLPNGNWINPLEVTGLRQTTAGHDQHFVNVDTAHSLSVHCVEFDSHMAATDWKNGFADICNAAQAASKVSNKPAVRERSTDRDWPPKANYL